MFANMTMSYSWLGHLDQRRAELLVLSIGNHAHVCCLHICFERSVFATTRRQRVEVPAEAFALCVLLL